MPNPPISIQSDGVLERFVRNTHKSSKWIPRILKSNMTRLGKDIVKKMRAEVKQHRYKGDLSRSIQSEYQPTEVTIGPTAKRGRYDAGVILELGTKPIPNLPWKPIADWAKRRKIPAFPVWYSIRKHGVKAHPFLQRTLVASEGLIHNTAVSIADKGAEKIVGKQAEE